MTDDDLDILLTCDAAELTRRVDAMSKGECERHARAILDRIGGPTFEKYLDVIARTMVPSDGSGPPETIDAYYFAVRDLFPHISEGSDVLGRLCCLVVQMCRLHLRETAEPPARPTDDSGA